MCRFENLGVVFFSWCVTRNLGIGHRPVRVSRCIDRVGSDVDRCNGRGVDRVEHCVGRVGHCVGRVDHCVGRCWPMR